MTEIILKDIFKSYDQTEVIHGVDLIGTVMKFEMASTWSKKLAIEFTNQVFSPYILPPFSN